MSLLSQGMLQVTAAAKAGMSERTARKYVHSGRAPSQAKVAHTWRTRPDPFVEVWPEVEALLRQDPGLQAKTIWMELNERHAGRFSAGQLRTLQRPSRMQCPAIPVRSAAVCARRIARCRVPLGPP
ncbi:MAG TPA: hypothetical protein VHC20_03925 [Candidatus Paceibacterota bacterium]|jgi:hypothetical protein|nr:hypothetical protein [Candidatus Paceibacterota bacterium]